MTLLRYPERMVPYRALKPKTDRQKSPRAAARERLRADVAALQIRESEGLDCGLAPLARPGMTGGKLPAAPTKLQQLEALVKAGRVSDPLAGIEACLMQTEQSAPHPDLLPTSGEKEQEESLTARVQVVYEHTILPVREIARLIGVSERTIYKYVARYGWQRRYVRPLRAKTAKGAGGRFIAREAESQPQASGPMALDPLAAQRAGAAIERVQLMSDIAVAEALAAAHMREADQRRERELARDVRALGHLTRAMRDLTYVAKAEQTRDTQQREAAERARAEQQQEERRAEELRGELARKLEAMVAAQRDAAAAEDAAEEGRDDALFPSPGPRSVSLRADHPLPASGAREVSLPRGPRIRGFHED
ncbi:MAG: terminase gpP N-terminus-related DNA-binding protein [Pseudolabrys sp.]